MPGLSAAAQKDIQAKLDATTDPKSGTGVPGLVFCAIDKSGKYLTQNTSGFRGLTTSQSKSPTSSPATAPMTLDTVFWIASCTKMITGLAAMQLVEQGKLSLDDHDSLYKVCPELKDKKVLLESGELVDKKTEITLRMLLAHTAGFGYSFFNERLRDYSRPTGWDEFSGDSKDFLSMPLVNQPGSRWEYGINIDWAGIAVERISGMTLDAYFKKYIFEPLDIKNISFLPSQHMRENMVTAQQRKSDGSSFDIDHPYRRAIWLADSHPESLMCSGGGGCFAKPSEYCQILTTLLNDGVSPNTGNRILKPESVEAMFDNSVKDFPDYARTPLPAAKPQWTNALPELYPQEGNPPQGWGLTFMETIEPGPTGRGRNTAWWAGIMNLFWWCDREKGVAGIIAAQIAPFGDPHVMGTWGACEAMVYGGLEK